MCLARAAGVSPASPDLTARKSLVEIKHQAPKVQGKKKSHAPGQVSPDQGQRHRYPLGIPSLPLVRLPLAHPFVGQH